MEYFLKNIAYNSIISEWNKNNIINFICNFYYLKIIIKYILNIN